jgi:hypothetical protein
MAQSRGEYEEKLDLLMREAIAETTNTLGAAKRDAPVFWRITREGFLRRLLASPNALELLRVLIGDEIIGIKTRPLFDRLKRSVPVGGDGGGGTRPGMSEDQSGDVHPPSTGSEGETAREKVSIDQPALAAPPSDNKPWEPKAPPKSPPRPPPQRQHAHPDALIAKWRVWSGFQFKYRGKEHNVADLPVHRLKPLVQEFGERAVRAVVPFNVLRSTYDYVQRQAHVPPESTVRSIVPEQEGERILTEARKRAEGMLFMLPKGMRVPLVLHDD